MHASSVAAKIEKSRAAAVELQTVVDEYDRDIAAATKALATARRAQAKHAAKLKAMEERCLKAADEADNTAQVVDAATRQPGSERSRPSEAQPVVEAVRGQALDALRSGPAQPCLCLRDRLAGGVVTLVVEGEALVVHARILAESPYFAARLARWDEATEPLRLEIPTAGTKDVLALLERLYAGPSAEAWRVHDVAGGFRVAAVCALLMLDNLLVEIAGGIRRIATTEDIEQVRTALAGQDWPATFVHALEDLAAQHNSMPEPEAVAELVLNTVKDGNADRPAVSSLLAAWRGGLSSEAVADGLLEAVNAWSSVPSVEMLRWICSVVGEYLKPDQATEVFAAFAGHPMFDVYVQNDNWTLFRLGEDRHFHSIDNTHKGTVELCRFNCYSSVLDGTVVQTSAGWPSIQTLTEHDINNFYVGKGSPSFKLNNVHAELRRAYVAHVVRCVDEGDDILHRALDIAFDPIPSRFPQPGSAATSMDGRKRRRLDSTNYDTWRRQGGGNRVHAFYLGPVRACQHTTSEKLSNAICFVWGPGQLQQLVEGRLHKALVQKLASCPGPVIAHVLDSQFLQKLEVDEQKSLLVSLGKSPTLLQEWATAERLGALTLPAKKQAGALLLPAVATLNPEVRQIVMGLALG